MLLLPQFPEIPMDFSFEGRNLDNPQNLVLYLYFSWIEPVHLGSPQFVAKIYEGTKEDSIGCKIPLFCCNGTGNTEISRALALLDVLLGRYRKTSLRGPVETWILECEALQAESCKLCIEIRNEGHSKEICLPAFRIHPDAPFIRREYPTPMVYKAISSLKSMQIEDKLKHLSPQNYGPVITIAATPSTDRPMEQCNAADSPQDATTTNDDAR